MCWVLYKGKEYGCFMSFKALEIWAEIMGPRIGWSTFFRDLELIGGLEHFFSNILGIIIPIDDLIFFRGFETTNQIVVPRWSMVYLPTKLGHLWYIFVGKIYHTWIIIDGCFPGSESKPGYFSPLRVPTKDRRGATKAEVLVKAARHQSLGCHAVWFQTADTKGTFIEWY